MRVIQYHSFGDSGVIRLNETAKPYPKEDEVLIRVAATTVNPFDIKVRKGYMQQQMTVNMPYIPGVDLAGTIEVAGSKVTKFKTGDLVYANVKEGAYAEYVVCAEGIVDTIPANVNMEQAAALVVPLATSYTLLVEHGALKPGQKVLIHGAAGGIGLVMVQMAKALGAYVIANAAGDAAELLKHLGADEVIDYRKQDIAQSHRDIDLVTDLVGGDTQVRSFEMIKKGGLLLTSVMPPSEELAAKHGVNAKFVFTGFGKKAREFVKALVEEGKIQPQIARVFKLENAAEAQDLVSAGGVRGKVVLTV